MRHVFEEKGTGEHAYIHADYAGKDDYTRMKWSFKEDMSDVEFEISLEKGVVSIDIQGDNVTTNAAGPAVFEESLAEYETGVVISDDEVSVTPIGTAGDKASVTLPRLKGKMPEAWPKVAQAIIGQDNALYDLAYAMSVGENIVLEGPTGVGKTSMPRYLAHLLGWNYVRLTVSRGTQDYHLVGENKPGEVAGEFPWIDGPVTRAVRLSKLHPTILVLDELNRIGNQAEFARIYSLLDDDKVLELPEKANKGIPEQIYPGNLVVVSTMNPIDDEGGDYVGVRDLDQALSSRLGPTITVSYPDQEVEVATLVQRTGITVSKAQTMVHVATVIRQSPDIRYPVSFRELEKWAKHTMVQGYDRAAISTFVNKAPMQYRKAIADMVKLKTKAKPVSQNKKK